MSCCTLLLIVVLLPPTQMYNEVQFSRILAPEWITRSNLALAGCYLTQGSGVRGMSYIVRSQNRDEDVICWQKMVITIMIILMVGDVIMISRSTSSKLVQFWERFPQAAWVSKTWISSLGNESRKTALWGLEKKTYFEIHHAITLLHNVNMNFVKFKVVCKMTATFWRPASREWATMGCSAMSWLLANRPQWSASTPRWPERPVLWETLVSHRRGSLWVVRARALGEPLEGHKQQQHQRKHQLRQTHS